MVPSGITKHATVPFEQPSASPGDRVIWAIRHPRPSVGGICYGWDDIPCDAPPEDPWSLFAAAGAPHQGEVADARALHLWSSDSARCRTLAEALGRTLGITPRLTGNLRELFFGAFEGQPWDEIHAAMPDALEQWGNDPWRTPPHLGESPAALMARVSTFCRELEPGVHLVVTHATIVRALRAMSEGTGLPEQAALPVPHLVPERLVLP